MISVPLSIVVLQSDMLGALTLLYRQLLVGSSRNTNIIQLQQP